MLRSFDIWAVTSVETTPEAYDLVRLQRYNYESNAWTLRLASMATPFQNLKVDIIPDEIVSEDDE